MKLVESFPFNVVMLTVTCAAFREIGVELLVAEGDTIASLSQKYGFAEAKLEQANGGIHTHNLQLRTGRETLLPLWTNTKRHPACYCRQ